ncbi:conjugal transfer protein TraB [Salmonella enterica subsp. enterica serovar Ajiobo]|nr:conjugal transfer protein TraB [Salmonella enterica subsp. enterica serovar Ajiobo]
MANINVKTRRKQMVVLIAVLCGLGVIGGVAWYLGQPVKPAAKAAPKPAPNMTGVVSSSFDKKLEGAAVANLQETASEADKKIRAFSGRIDKLEQTNKAYRDKIEQQEKDLSVLQEQLTELQSERAFPSADTGGNGFPAGSMPSPNAGASQPVIPPPTAFYPGGQGYAAPQSQLVVNPDLGRGLSSVTIEYEDDKEPEAAVPELPYIPSGSFAQAVIIEGADANASVTGNSNPSPMQFRLTGPVLMANNEEYDLRGCMVTAGVYGDISSERALVRTDRLSCKLFGHTVDMKFKGHISFMGKNGIKGEPVIRNGEMIGYAFAGGAIDAIGGGIGKVGQTTVGIGAADTTSFGDVARAGLGSGTSQVGKTLFDYFIKRAEQYHPVIPIGAGVDVTVVFQEGFQLEFADVKKKKAAKTPVKEAVQQGITVSKETLRELNLGSPVPSNPAPAPAYGYSQPSGYPQ